jgi:hypothetical protein
MQRYHCGVLAEGDALRLTPAGVTRANIHLAERPVHQRVNLRIAVAGRVGRASAARGITSA